MRLPATWNRLAREQRTTRRRRARVRTLAHARRRASGRSPAPLDPITSAKVAGLRYVNDLHMPGIRRVGSKQRVRYVAPDGRAVQDRATRDRIR